MYYRTEARAPLSQEELERSKERVLGSFMAQVGGFTLYLILRAKENHSPSMEEVVKSTLC